MEDLIGDALTRSRVKKNFGLLLLSIFTVAAMFAFLYYYDKDIKTTQQLFAAKGKIVRVKEELNDVSVSLSQSRNELKQSRNELKEANEKLVGVSKTLSVLGAEEIKGIRKNSYTLRNKIEEIELKLEGEEKEELNKVRIDLIDMLSEIEAGLEEIIGLLESEQRSVHFGFSLFSTAHAEDAEVFLAKNDIRVLMFGAFLIALTLIVMLAIVLSSKDKEKVEFAQSIIKSICAFAVGVVGGKIV